MGGVLGIYPLSLVGPHVSEGQMCLLLDPVQKSAGHLAKYRRNSLLPQGGCKLKNNTKCPGSPAGKVYVGTFGFVNPQFWFWWWEERWVNLFSYSDCNWNLSLSTGNPSPCSRMNLGFLTTPLNLLLLWLFEEYNSEEGNWQCDLRMVRLGHVLEFLFNQL